MTSTFPPPPNPHSVNSVSDREILKQLDRIEYKIDQVTRALSTMIDALAMEEEGEPEFDLDGQRIPDERQEGQPL